MAYFLKAIVRRDQSPQENKYTAHTATSACYQREQSANVSRPGRYRSERTVLCFYFLSAENLTGPLLPVVGLLGRYFLFSFNHHPLSQSLGFFYSKFLLGCKLNKKIM